MKAGALNEHITILHPTIVKSDYGSENVSWSNYSTTRAEVKYNSGSRITENNEIINTHSIIFRIRSYHQITEKMRIKYNNRLYYIISVEPNKLYQSITIKADLINE